MQKPVLSDVLRPGPKVYSFGGKGKNLNSIFVVNMTFSKKFITIKGIIRTISSGVRFMVET
jgi:hypothetical protein